MYTTEKELTRVKNDVNGNPRYVVHFLNLLSDQDDCESSLSKYSTALAKSRAYGGKKFNNKQYGGGIVFQCYNTGDLLNFINECNGSK